MSDINLFHGREVFTEAAKPISYGESIRNVLRALWNNRAAIKEEGGLSAAKRVLEALPLDDPIGDLGTRFLVHKLWGPMLHPPSSYRGAKYQYRAPDGKNNSMLYPELGMAGLPYAKSVQAQKPVHGAKPDPGDLFDLLMGREESKDKTGRESETGLSSFILYQATIVIHDVFRTNFTDRNISDTSSYLDLSPLYGKDAKEQAAVRKFELGLLKPDTFSESRLLNQPPGVSIFLIMYNRFHNYVAKQLREINEDGKFELPLAYSTMTKKQKKLADAKLDEDLFQTARLITCGLYAQIAIHDYLRCLMGTHDNDSPWTLDPRKEYSAWLDRGTISRGQGNMVSVEFNLLYRFHSALSKRDAAWSEELFVYFLQKLPGDDGKTPMFTRDQIINGEVKPDAMMFALKASNDKAEKDLHMNTKSKYFPMGFDGVGENPGDFAFKRDPETGYFDDAQMVAELVRSFEDPMCSFGAQQIPKVFKSIEILGILQARKWEVSTLNEFRKFFNMSVHQKFEDINEDAGIVNAMRDLYGHVDNVELYPGYLCEGQGNNLDPAKASCPNRQATALWAGVFSDAVTLVRSDRFYTTEWNVNSLTNWGLREVTSDPTINKGGLLYKLCLRAFPEYFTYNAMHLWEPYYTPGKNLVLAHKQGRLKNLDIEGLEFRFETVKGQGGPWTDLAIHRDAEGNLEDAFFKELAKELDKKLEDPTRLKFRLRRKMQWAKRPLEGREALAWRGHERASKVVPKSVVIGGSKGDFQVIQDILTGPDSSQWANPAMTADFDIPKGALRQVLTNQFDPQRWNSAMEILANTVGITKGQIDSRLFREYFSSLAATICEREQRPLQKITREQPPDNPKVEQIYQIDIVSDFAIPVIARFFGDWLGFWTRMKSERHPNREFSENAIYDLLNNCQDYKSWDSDPTSGMKRRQLFQSSIIKLKELADYGVTQSSPGFLWFRDLWRTYGDGKTPTAVVNMRMVAVKSVRALRSARFSNDEVSAIMLRVALQTINKLVLNFTEIVAYFIDPRQHEDWKIGSPRDDPRTKLWAALSELASGRSSDQVDAKITQYVLEAQRLTPALTVARQYIGKAPTNLNRMQDGEIQKIEPGTVVLLDISAANHDPTVFSNPDEFQLNRHPDNYIVYGSILHKNAPEAPAFGKQLALAYLTSLLRYTASMKNVRVAHDKLGRLKKVRTPAGLPGNQIVLQRYMSPEWDSLVAFPTTWDLRFDGIGKGVYTGADNANQGHGQNQVYQESAKSAANAVDDAITYKEEGAVAPPEDDGVPVEADGLYSGKMNGKPNGHV